jgi:hypothetical protein
MTSALRTQFSLQSWEMSKLGWLSHDLPEPWTSHLVQFAGPLLPSNISYGLLCIYLELILALAFTQPLTEMSTRSIKIIMFLGVKCGWCVGLTTLPPSVSQLSRQCGILNISQPYRPARPVMGIALLYGDRVCFPWGTNWTVSTATSNQYLTVNCEPIV